MKIKRQDMIQILSLVQETILYDYDFLNKEDFQ